MQTKKSNYTMQILKKLKQISNISRTLGLGIFAAICGSLFSVPDAMAVIIDCLKVLSASLIATHFFVSWWMLLKGMINIRTLTLDGLIDLSLLLLSLGVAYSNGLLIGLALGCGFVAMFFMDLDDISTE